MTSVTTAHLTDALPTLPGPQAVQLVRQFVDRISAVQVDDRGVTLQGVTGRTVAWDELRRVELLSRVDDVLRLAIGFTPLGRLPVVGDKAQDLVLKVATAFDPAPLMWLRDRAGWVVIRLVTRRPIEVQRLPGLTVRLYPSVSRAIVAQARERDIEVVRLGLDTRA